MVVNKMEKVLAVYILCGTFTALVSAALIDDTPVWPGDCGSFITYRGKFVQAGYYHRTSSPVMAESTCRYLCQEDRHCGLYMWHIYLRHCSFFSHSVNMWGAVAALPGHFLMTDDEVYNVGSKTCQADVTQTSCHGNHYPIMHNRERPDKKHEITYVSTTHQLWKFNCWLLCSGFSKCRSVLYMKSSIYFTCILHSTTITQLYEQEAWNEIHMNYDYVNAPTYESYERYSGDEPYNPSDNEKTSLQNFT